VNSSLVNFDLRITVLNPLVAPNDNKNNYNLPNRRIILLIYSNIGFRVIKINDDNSIINNNI
jgi:hypothetical protein